MLSRKLTIMLMMLAMVLMILSTATANDLDNLQAVPDGYFVSEDAAKEIIDQYPDLEKVFENEMEVEAGSYMTDDTTVELGNRINEIKADRDKFQEKYKVTHEALKEERKQVEEMKEADEKVIKLQDAQIEGWKERYDRQQSQNLIEKAGFAAIIALLAVSD